MRCFNQITVRLHKPIWSVFDNAFVMSVLIPCGKCGACIERKIMETSFRLNEEWKSAECTYFITLTYDNEHVPINEYGRMTLKKEDLQLFFKNIKQHKRRTFNNTGIKKGKDKLYGTWEQHYYRSNLSTSKIKYYAVGEYGTNRKRPHYHAITFNISRSDIERYWIYGIVDIQIPRGKEALSYVAKYMYKRTFEITPKSVKPEFAIMSKGIGDCYVDKMKSYYNRNLDVLNTATEYGILVPMSKYYRHKFWNEDKRREQIPLIKAAVQLDEMESIRDRGEDGHYLNIENKKRQYSIKIKRKFKPRKDT